MKTSPLKFIGRVTVIQELKEEVVNGDAPIVTLHGYGGIGKTRLANEIVTKVTSEFEAGTHSVVLDNEPWEDSSQVTPEQLAGVIARSIDAPDTVSKNPEERLLTYLQHQGQMLVLLDNWDSTHNTSTVKWIAKAAQTVPNVRWMITSRNILGIPNIERVFEITPMEIPQSETDGLAELDGYQLFAERVHLHQATHPLSDNSAIRRILIATHGFPLGIELVAAQIRDYSLQEIAEGLEQSLLDWQKFQQEDIYVGPPRHESLEACLDWSVSRLPQDQRAKFYQLSIFPSSFSNRSAHKVTGMSENWPRLWHRAALVESIEVQGQTRYLLLPVVREYASLHLRKNDPQGLQRRFIEHFAGTMQKGYLCNPVHAEDRAQAILGKKSTWEMVRSQKLHLIKEAFQILELERANWMYALTLAIAENDCTIAYKSYLATHTFMAHRSYWSNATSYGERILSLIDQASDWQKELDNENLSHLLRSLGEIYVFQSRWSDAERCLRRATESARSHDFQFPLAQAFSSLGWLNKEKGQLSEAKRYAQEALKIYKTLVDKNSRVRNSEAVARFNLGEVYHEEKNWSAAEECYQQSLIHFKESDDRHNEGHTWSNLGAVFKEQPERWGEAERCFEQALSVLRDVDAQVREGEALRNFAELRVVQEDFAGAVELGREAVQVLEKTEDQRMQTEVQNSLREWEAILASKLKPSEIAASPDEPQSSVDEELPLASPEPEQLSRGLTWLHLSDFHINAGDRYERDKVLQTLVAAIRHFCEKETYRPDLIFATGDIVFKGDVDLYKQATIFFDQVLDAAGLDKSRLFVIPGNHDVNRDAGNWLVRTLNTEEESVKYFSEEQTSPHFDKLREFRDWHNSYFAGIRSFESGTTCQEPETVTIDGLRVTVLPINSALFCIDEHDDGKLWIGRRCLDKAVTKMDEVDTDIRVALIHHSLEALHEIERTNIESKLSSAVDIVLRGHLHESSAKSVSNHSDSILHLAAGASYQTRDYPNLALFARIRFDEQKLFLFPIRYVDSPQETWTTDSALFPHESNHEGEFPVSWKSLKV